MKNIKFKCDLCGQILETPPDMGGKTVECPNCQASLAVPEPLISDRIIVSTGDIPTKYEVIGPVFFCLTNRGILGSQYQSLRDRYLPALARAKTSGHIDFNGTSAGDLFMLLVGDLNIEARQYEVALFIGIEEMKKRAARLRANAVIWLRHDLDIDPTGLEFFYLQMMGTAIRFSREAEKA